MSQHEEPLADLVARLVEYDAIRLKQELACGKALLRHLTKGELHQLLACAELALRMTWRTDPPPVEEHILLHRPPGIHPPFPPIATHWMPLPDVPGPPPEPEYVKLFEKREDEP